jgi:hypothetical protein
MERSLPSETAFTYLTESPVMEPSLQVPLTVVPLRVSLSFQGPLHPSLKVPSKHPSALMERRIHFQSLTLRIV